MKVFTKHAPAHLAQIAPSSPVDQRILSQTPQRPSPNYLEDMTSAAFPSDTQYQESSLYTAYLDQQRLEPPAPAVEPPPSNPPTPEN